MPILLCGGTGTSNIRVKERKDKSEIMDAIKIEVGSKYILIVKQELSDDEKVRLLESINKLLNDDSIHIMVLQGIDCTLEKVR